MTEFFISLLVSACGVFLTAGVGWSVKSLQAKEKIKQKEREEDRARDTAMEQGLRAMLRDRLLQSCEYYGKQGYADVRAKTNIQMMYEAYHALGGNGVVTDAYNDFRNLPHYEKIEKEKG